MQRPPPPPKPPSKAIAHAKAPKLHLAAAKAAGKQLGRPKGSKNKKGRALDIYRADLKKYLELNLSITSIMKIINPQLPKPLSYHTYRYYIQHDDDLLQVKNS